uniref:Neuronal tyrosine-phosphorylated phosphoinositide-3-kinase adaptor 2a n=1 Tax=Eptatretus burgeri TaxID=7764 RepID=A0A8C4QZ54_EPTBU
MMTIHRVTRCRRESCAWSELGLGEGGNVEGERDEGWNTVGRRLVGDQSEEGTPAVCCRHRVALRVGDMSVVECSNRNAMGAMGPNRVLLKPWHGDQLVEICQQLHRRVVICQKAVRHFLAHQRLHQRLRLRRRQVSLVEAFLGGLQAAGLRVYNAVAIQNATDGARGRHALAWHTSAPRHGLSREAKAYELAGERYTHCCCQPTGGLAPSPRRPPPPKPKRNPTTRLSRSYEGGYRPSSGHSAVGDGAGDAKPRPHSDDFSNSKKVPPPKPTRHPATRLSSSYEEIGGRRGNAGTNGARLLNQTSADAACGDDCEPVYIEMGATNSTRPGAVVMSIALSPGFELGESEYEEMKYFFPEAPGLLRRPARLCQSDSELDRDDSEKLGHGAITMAITGGRSPIPPPPFPDLLPHRPPLLVLPTAPATTPIPQSNDESPLTPLEVKQLPLLESAATSYTAGVLSPPANATNTRPQLNTKAGTLPGPTHQQPAASHQRQPTRMLTLSGRPPTSEPTRKTCGRTQPRPCQTSGSDVKGRSDCGRGARGTGGSLPNRSRSLTSPLDELACLFSSGRMPLRSSSAGRRMRQSQESEEATDRLNGNGTPVTPGDTSVLAAVESPQLSTSTPSPPGAQPASSPQEQRGQAGSSVWRDRAALPEVLEWRRRVCDESGTGNSGPGEAWPHAATLPLGWKHCGRSKGGQDSRACWDTEM